MAAVLAAVTAELEGVKVPAWKSELALALASAMDDEPTAAVAAQLRVLMNDIRESSAPAAESVLDELQRKREERRARRAAGS